MKNRLLSLLLCGPLWALGCNNGLEPGPDCGPPPNFVVGAQLQFCDLSNVFIGQRDLSGADFSGANLNGADMSGSSLNGAILAVADLTGASLTGCDLTGADLTRANLLGAGVEGAFLRNANLTGADLKVADLQFSDFTGATGQPLNANTAIYFGTICPNGVNSDDAGNTCVGQGF